MKESSRDRENCLPKFQLKTAKVYLGTILQNQKKISEYLKIFKDRQILSDDIKNWIQKFQEILRFSDRENSLFRSLFCHIGQSLTESLIHDISWRLSGNKHYLVSGIAVPPWTVQPASEYVYVQVLSVFPKKSKRIFRDSDTKEKRSAAVIGSDIYFKILTGFPAGKIIKKFYSNKYLNYRRVEFGFNRRRFIDIQSSIALHANKYPVIPYIDSRDIGRFRFLALLTPESCSKGYPDFVELLCPPKVRSWNISLLKKRRRFGYKCPNNWSIPCYECPVGWDHCDAATHPKNFIKKICPQCHNNSFFDPIIPTKVCLMCYAQGTKTKISLPVISDKK
jgi:hypothetical protein